MRHGLGDNEKEISAPQAGGGKHNTAQAGQDSPLTRNLWGMSSLDASQVANSGITGNSLMKCGSRGEQGMFSSHVGIRHPISQKQSVNWSITASLQENLEAVLTAAAAASPTACGPVRQPLLSSPL